jgi:hypothetical protein
MCSQEVEARTQTDGTTEDIPSDPATRVRGNRRVRALAYNVARQQVRTVYDGQVFQDVGCRTLA